MRLNIDEVTFLDKFDYFTISDKIGILVIKWKIFPKNVQIIYSWQNFIVIIN